MKVVKPLYYNKNNPKQSKGKVHIAKDLRYTVCGVYYKVSEVLGFSEEGELEEVTCTRCKNQYKKA